MRRGFFVAEGKKIEPALRQALEKFYADKPLTFKVSFDFLRAAAFL